MFKNLITLTLILAASILALTACANEETQSDAVNQSAQGAQAIQAGEDLFSRSVIGSQAGCIACHSLSPGVTLVGPSLAGIGSRAGDTVPGQSADEYLREAILNPDAYIVEGFPEGAMPPALAEELSSEQIDNLVTYMLSLK
ncbi:MAG: c-type cytochrome [Anaerolineales bacterium]|nr:c-type cytochrome [Anaerolineales bacterium]